ncbi:ABC transporter permease [Spinactinospora alkalitolerans]|uniref:ABC transporter permease n=1 Tax=Spinactinospora alkalitolerans TaxID=687207 RepID=UPI001C5356A0|nr:ABC-2 family transporter protein [Spinactinospora alkalitolerans]
MAWAWCRAVAQYPLSLALLTLAQAAASGLELAALFFVFGHAGRLAGFGLHEALLIYGLSGVAFCLADLLMGSVERLGEHVRSGAFDTMLVRPVSPLVQLATDGFSPRRLGKVAPSAATLAWALVELDIEWTPERALLLPVLICSGVAVCAALWIIGACVQFFVAEAREVANSVTYGGQALTEYPLAVYGRDVVRAVTFLVPLAFVSWQPALYLLDWPDPLGMAEWLRFASPGVAVVLCLLAALVWRTGLRHYRSTGS